MLGQKYCLDFINRFPHSYMKLIIDVKEPVHKFWHENTRTSSNKRDILKLRNGTNERQTHVKHFLEMTETKIY